MTVYARHQTHADSSADRFGHTALVDGTQAGLVAVFDAAHVGDVLGHDAKVLHEITTQSICPLRPPLESPEYAPGDDMSYLIMLPRIHSQLIHDVPIGLSLPTHLLPLRHLNPTQIMRRIDIAHPPPARHLRLVVLGRVLHGELGFALLFLPTETRGRGILDGLFGDLDGGALRSGWVGAGGGGAFGGDVGGGDGAGGVGGCLGAGGAEGVWEGISGWMGEVVWVGGCYQ